jgi:PAS domain S-box-containing protein
MEVYQGWLVLILLLALLLLVSWKWYELSKQLRLALEKQLEENSQKLKFELLCQSASIGLALIDADLNILFMNDFMKRLTGFRPDPRSDPFHLSDFFPALVARMPPDLLDQLQTNSSLIAIDVRMPDQLDSQRSRNFQAHFSLARQPGDQPSAITLTLHDTSEQKQVEETLRASELRFRRTADIANLLVYEWDFETGEIARLSSSLGEKLGSHALPGKDSGQEWREKVHPDDLRRIQEKFVKTIESGDSFEEEYRILNRHHEYMYVWDRGVVIRDEDGRPMKAIGVSIDIDARKKLEEQLQLYAQTLATADRRKDEFIAMLSHELRNPLTPIVTAVALLKKMSINDDKLLKAIDLISRQASYMSRIVNDLLDISRMTRGTLLIQKKLADLTEILRHVIADHSDLMEQQGLVLRTNLLEQALWIDGDETRLAQAMGNILHNSLKFTAQGGTISIELSRDAVKSEALVIIRDTGIGISAEILPHVFDGFTQGTHSIDRRKGGLGIGLTLVKFIVEKHGGLVTVDSAGHQRGTEFKIKFPLADQKFLAATADESILAQPKPRQVLLIEDQPDIVLVLRLFLEDILGFQVMSATEAKSGLSLARQLHPAIIICDIGLPGDMDGYELAKAIRAIPELNASKLIALTGYGTRSDKERSHQAGFDMHMTKPPNLEQLQEALIH